MSRSKVYSHDQEELNCTLRRPSATAFAVVPKTHGSSIELRSLIEPIFIKYGVDAVFSGPDHVYERVQPQKGIYYFTEGSSGQFRNGDLAKTGMTEKGFDSDRTFMLVEVAGDEMYFQTLSRTGNEVESGMLPRHVRPPETTTQ